MDYVYVCRPGDNEELRYSIRSTVKNLPEGRIWVVGGKPDWYTGDYIYVQQTGIGHPNVWKQLDVICATEDISDDFVLMNDDFFTVKKLDRTKYSKAIEVLLAKPRIIVVSNVNGSSTYFRSFVRFNGMYEIEYTN